MKLKQNKICQNVKSGVNCAGHAPAFKIFTALHA